MRTPEPVHIPSIDDLHGCVVARGPRPTSATGGPEAPRERERAVAHLSREAQLFLLHAATTCHKMTTLEQRWETLGITSGSKKKRIVNELLRFGLIRLEYKGKSRTVHLFKAAWKYLDMEPPKSTGTGGAIHQFWVREIARTLRKRGYDVHVEFALGPARKRVDVVAFGETKIGVEVALTSLEQELRNIREDLACDVLDRVIVASPDEAFLKRIKASAERDDAIRPHLHQIQFRLLNHEETHA